MLISDVTLIMQQAGYCTVIVRMVFQKWSKKLIITTRRWNSGQKKRQCLIKRDALNSFLQMRFIHFSCFVYTDILINVRFLFPYYFKKINCNSYRNSQDCKSDLRDIVKVVIYVWRKFLLVTR